MTLQGYPRFLKWGETKSEDRLKPDVIHCKVIETNTFETKYAICVNVEIANTVTTLPLYNFSSTNKSLLDMWTKSVEDGIVKKGIEFKIITLSLIHI